MHSKWIASCHLMVLTLCALAALTATNSLANIRLPAIIGDNMVLQAGDRVRLWGWADPNEEIEVNVSWRDFQWSIQADEAGKWQFPVERAEHRRPLRKSPSKARTP